MNPKPTQHRGAFTLIELLVVIAIISLLVSILLPSLQKAKELAKITICATQLRTLGMAINTYAEENEGQYPDCPRTDPGSPEVVHPDFTSSLQHYDCPANIFYCPLKPKDEFEWIYTWYIKIGYTYLGRYSDSYDTWFKNDYHSPQTLESSQSSWVLMTDMCRMYEDQTNHYFGDNNINTNVLFVDIHVENRIPQDPNFDTGGGYWVWW